VYLIDVTDSTILDTDITGDEMQIEETSEMYVAIRLHIEIELTDLMIDDIDERRKYEYLNNPTSIYRFTRIIILELE